MRIPIAYTWRSLWTRRLTTTLTLTGIALVVFVFATRVDALPRDRGRADRDGVGRQRHHPPTVRLLRAGLSDREGNGHIVKTLPEVAKKQDGKPLATTETYIVINLAKKVSRDMGNIAVRGISPEAWEIRPLVRLTEGRMLRFGTNEILVGENVAKSFEGCEIGQTLRFAEGPG